MNSLIDMLLDSSTFIHAAYILLIFVLFIENRTSSLMLYKSIDKNITIGDTLNKFKTNLVAMQAEQIRLIKESHQNAYEIQMLNQQLVRLREELKVIAQNQRKNNADPTPSAFVNQQHLAINQIVV